MTHRSSSSSSFDGPENPREIKRSKEEVLCLDLSLFPDGVLNEIQMSLGPDELKAMALTCKKFRGLQRKTTFRREWLAEWMVKVTMQQHPYKPYYFVLKTRNMKDVRKILVKPRWEFTQLAVGRRMFAHNSSLADVVLNHGSIDNNTGQRVIDFTEIYCPLGAVTTNDEDLQGLVLIHKGDGYYCPANGENIKIEF